MKRIIVFILLFFSYGSLAQLEGVYTVIIKKQEQKQKSRWTLADWLATKKTIALQDQWLALHSSETWFEFILDYGGGDLDRKVGNANTSIGFSRWGAALYLKFLGFEYSDQSFDQLYDSSDYRLNLLILGSSVQSTHLRAFYGQRDYSYLNYSSYDQDFWGANFTLYLASFVGVETMFTKFLKTTSGDELYESYGERREFSAFIDIWMLRLYATQFRERMLYSGSNFHKSTVEGTLIGAKLFF